MVTYCRIGLLLLASSTVFAVRAQVPCNPTFVAGVPNAFQVSHATELNTGGAYVTLSNTGASSTVAFPNQNGALRVNMYFFTPTGFMASCCTCPVKANGQAKVGVGQALAGSAFLPLSSVSVKLIATLPPNCTLTDGLTAQMISTAAAPATPGGATAVRLQFTPSTLSAAELTRLETICAFVLNGATSAICNGCSNTP